MKLFAIIHWMVRIAGGVMLLVATAIASAFLLLNTNSGMNWLARQIHQRTSGIVELKNISLHLPDRIRASSLVLRDHGGTVWLHGENLETHLQVGALRNKIIQITSLTASNVVWRQMPRFNTSSRAQEEAEADAPAVEHLVLDRLFIQHAVIEKGIIAHRIDGSIEGSAQWNIQTNRIYATARSVAGIDARWPFELSADFVYMDRAYFFPRLSLKSADPRVGYFAQGEMRIRPGDGHELITARVDQLEYKNEPFALRFTEPAVYTLSNRFSRIEMPGISINQATAAIDATIAGRKLDALNIRGGPVNLSRLPSTIITNWPPINGLMDFDIRMQNLTSEPGGYAKADIRELAIHLPALASFSNLHIEAGAELSATGLIASARTKIPWLDLAISLSGTTLPYDGLIPLRFDHDAGVRTHLNAKADLQDAIKQFIDSPVSLSGKIEADMSVLSRGDVPAFDGLITWREGELRHPSTGTFLEQIDVRLRGAGNTLTIESAEARDGGKGSITGLGSIVFNAGWSPSWSLSLDLKRASLFRLIRTELPLSGAISFSGHESNMDLRGDLKLNTFRFVIPRRLPPSIRQLDVIEINHPDPSRNTAQASTAAAEREMEQAPENPINLQIKIDSRDNFFLSGRGLQSEWRGTMTLGGNSAKPLLTGSAGVIRGYAMFLGRRFTIDEGRLELTGTLPPRPQLNIIASTRIGDVIARLEVRGTTDRPSIRLVSDPMLPEDEIMSIILFGKSTEAMTPWQAIALANGLSILSGRENDVVSVLERGQSFLNVDQIDIKQTEKGDGLAAIALGKHFGRSLYVEGEKGFGEAEDIVTVTLDISPRLVLETEASPRIREGINLYWRYDY